MKAAVILLFIMMLAKASSGGTGNDPSPHLYGGMFFWLDWLTLGFAWLYSMLFGLIKNAGLAILALSLCVKLILHPLMTLSDRWQREVNNTKARLAPEMARIRKESRGEERHNMTLALYRQHNVSPVYGLKSVFGVAIQIPIFFAAYHALSASPHLAGVSFLGISDLAKQDQLIPLFFADLRLNLLPFVMSAFTVLASSRFGDSTLSRLQVKRQRLNLYFMAGLFFALLYTFPAGVVLYWTSNNILAWVRQLAASVKDTAHA